MEIGEGLACFSKVADADIEFASVRSYKFAAVVNPVFTKGFSLNVIGKVSNLRSRTNQDAHIVAITVSVGRNLISVALFEFDARSNQVIVECSSIISVIVNPCIGRSSGSSMPEASTVVVSVNEYQFIFPSVS